MKLIVAIIRPEKLEAVQRALNASLSDALGYTPTHIPPSGAG